MTTARPSGRTDVMGAVLEAAADLFAEHGPAATPIRQVAALSGVNHGLVYRHFGTKDELVAAVVNYVSETLNQAVAENSPTVSDLAERQLRVLARAILDGYPVGKMQRRFPFVAQLVEEAAQHTDDQAVARLSAAHVLALQMGWRLFEPFIRSATGLEAVPQSELQRDALRLSRDIVTTTAQV